MGTKLPENYIRRSYAKDWRCILCDKIGDSQYCLGFCAWCYQNRYRRGIVDASGMIKRKLRRVKAYSDTDRCKIPWCKTKPKSLGMCRRHWQQECRGIIDEHGRRLKPRVYRTTNKGKTCSVDACAEDSTRNLMCRKHYDKKRRSK